MHRGRQLAGNGIGLLGQNLLHDSTVNVGEAKIATGVMVGESLMVES